MRICAGGLLVRGEEILLAKRAPERDFYPGVWDVIGGHCKEGEAPVDALAREMREEIGVTPSVFEEFAVLDEPDVATHGEGRYHFFIVRKWTGGEPRLRGPEHSELRWVTLEHALALPLAHSDYGKWFQSVLEGGSSQSSGR